MTLKRLLVLPLLISLALFGYFSASVMDSFERLTSLISITPAFAAIIALVVGLQLIGHIIRAKKSAILFGPVKKSSTRFQFRALSIGYLFNAVLPLRLGELIRARIISGAMSISFSYVLVLIILERLIDALILGTIGLIVILAFVRDGQSALLAYAISLLALAAVLLIAIMLLMRQNPRVLRLWHRTTGLLNDDLQANYRFKLWSVIYGLQRTIKRPLIRQYMLLTAASWLFYVASLMVVVQYLVGALSPTSKAVLVVAPYYGMAVPSGPANLGVFSNVVGNFLQYLHLENSAVLIFSLMAWAVLVLPIALIGIVLLFGRTRETLWRSPSKHVSRQSIENKLYRQEDISREMKYFLDKFFFGNSLSKIVHQLELSEGFRLVKYFKGGSDAITILALQDGQEVVKKIIPLEFEDRLKAQYDWLARRNGTPGIVRVLREEHTPHYYAIDLEYDPDNEMFYEYLHKHPITPSQKIMDNVWKSLYESIYSGVSKADYYPKARQAYIDKHIFGCLEKAAAVDPELARAAKPDTLVVNGKEYDNLFQIMEKIKQHPQAWRDIATFQRSEAVHGDVAIDNLLVSRKTGQVLMIDPAPDGNIINGPVFDFGKNMQSLHCGYETLLRDEDSVFLIDDSHIDYRDLSSDKYRELATYVRTELAPQYLSDDEQKAMLFHAGALLIRRLKHQIYYTPGNVLKIYAVGVKTLNEFLEQYETPAH